MISVVIPLFNKSAAIGRAVASVRAQTVTGWELVVVDDGSTDDSAEQVAAIADPRIRLVRQSNAGVSAARNRGIAETSGEVIAFLDGDDWWEDGHLAEFERLTARFPDAAMYSTAFAMDDGGRRKVVSLAGHSEDSLRMVEDYFSKAAQTEPPVNSSCVALRRRCIEAIGGFPEGIHAGEDLITWARLVCLGGLAYSPRVTSSYRPPPLGENERLAFIARRIPQKSDYVGAELALLARRHPAHNRAIHQYLAQWHRMRTTLFLELGLRLPTWSELARAVGRDRLRIRDAATLVLSCLPVALSRTVLNRIRRRSQGQ